MDELSLKISELNAGASLSYSGELIIMRDAAQKRLKMLLEENKPLPVDLASSVVFYAGPAKTTDGFTIGAIGPTTSSRMDGFLEMLFELGAIATIGKGRRTPVATHMCKKFGRVYLVAPSGAAASLALHINRVEIIAFDDLGTEAIRKVQVENFPVIVGIDSSGKDIFQERD